MNAFMDKDYSKKFLGKLPPKIQDRVRVLLSFHEDFKKIESEYEDREMEIRMKYDEKFAPLFQRRKEIIEGSDITEEEVKGGFPEDHENKVSLTEGEAGDEDALGNFWLTVLENHILIADLITKNDTDLLKHLVDISSCMVPGKLESFKVEFTFSPNDYIEESTLTISVVSKEDSVVIERSPMTLKEKGQTLFYKSKGKKGKGEETKVPNESFFWIFREIDEDKEELEEVVMEEEQLLNLLHTLHRKVIPAAVCFFTGEMDGASDMEGSDEDEDDEEIDSGDDQ